jgi:hypothetical protein
MSGVYPSGRFGIDNALFRQEILGKSSGIHPLKIMFITTYMKMSTQHRKAYNKLAAFIRTCEF